MTVTTALQSFRPGTRRASPGGEPAFRQLASFGAIGVVSTAAYAAIYALLRNVSPAEAANAFALLITAIGNTAANRRLTFGVEGRAGLARDHAAGLISLVVALALTSASLAVLNALAPVRSRVTELVVLIGANAAATVARFLLLRLVIDRRAPAAAAAAPVAASSHRKGMPDERHR